MKNSSVSHDDIKKYNDENTGNIEETIRTYSSKYDFKRTVFPFSPQILAEQAYKNDLAESAKQLFADLAGRFSTSFKDEIEEYTATVRDERKLDFDNHVTEISIYPTYNIIFRYGKAINAINNHAKSLGYAPNEGGDLIEVPGGFYISFPGNDIYYRQNGKTFEVHGDIRAKYNMLNGANGILGMPQSNETITPDGDGRFNHFDKGSIYWTPNTGPMAVRGAIRNRWAATGWEQGPFGYPVEDQYRMIQPHINAPIEWCRFQNGVIASDNNGAVDAIYATLNYGDIAALFGKRINEEFEKSPDNVAMRPGVDLIGITDWKYDFWSSKPRTLGFRFRGFRDNGLASDTDFAFDISISFKLVSTQLNPTFTLPLPFTMSLAAQLEFLRVTNEGGPPFFTPEVISGVSHSIHDSFFPPNWPNLDHPEIPQGSIYVADVNTISEQGVVDVLDVITAANGDLLVALNPLRFPNQPLNDTLDWPYLRKLFAQDKLNALMG